LGNGVSNHYHYLTGNHCVRKEWRQYETGQKTLSYAIKKESMSNTGYMGKVTLLKKTAPMAILVLGVAAVVGVLLFNKSEPAAVSTSPENTQNASSVGENTAVKADEPTVSSETGEQAAVGVSQSAEIQPATPAGSGDAERFAIEEEGVPAVDESKAKKQ
jgi:hypothetical protein